MEVRQRALVIVPAPSDHDWYGGSVMYFDAANYVPMIQVYGAWYAGPRHSQPDEGHDE